MTVKLRVQVQRDKTDSTASRDGAVGAKTDGTVTDLLDVVKVEASFNLSPGARAQPSVPEDIVCEDDDLLEIAVEDGFTTWISAKRYAEDVPLLRPQARDGDTVIVDTLPQIGDRGISEWVASKLRVLRLKENLWDTVKDPSSWPTDIQELATTLGLNLTTLPAWFITKLVIRHLEDRLEPGPGLYTWRAATQMPGQGEVSPVVRDQIDPDKPILVFIHGTASSTRGSFGAFLEPDAQPQWNALEQIFGDQIYAFEHRTLSESPIDNAIDLLEALPKNARVNIVSHSRGGLIGDLISLTSIDTEAVRRFERGANRLKEADEHDRRQLNKLTALIEENQLRIERFVRCAAPSRGTLLAGENIDRFLSVLTNLVQLVPGVGGTPLYEVIKRIALEIIRSRTEPAMVPGIEAMMPESPLVALLNNGTAPVRGEIGVVAGDIAGGNWLKRLGIFASDHIVYESRDNDLVVNTDAMFHGVRHEVSGYVFDQGADVSHFNYFRNPRTRAALVDWLAKKPGPKDLPTVFVKLPPLVDFSPQVMKRGSRAIDDVDAPIVFMLPDLMGSHLHVGDEQVWLSHRALVRGGMTDLADLGAAGITPVRLVEDGYRELHGHLEQSHVVVPFAYDWRKSITEAATGLATEVEKALKQTRKPVRFVAHGMGGLVVRAMIASCPELWDRVCERDGARLVMLGTPNRGSFDTVETLLGISTTVQQLALLDPTNNAATMAGVLAQFPGILDLLPDDHFAPDKWNGYQRTTPEPALLDAARNTRDGMAAHLSSVFPHADRVCYVAGASPRTVTGVKIVDGRALLTVTTEGDGRVTYKTGSLPGVPTWYVEAAHGDLASHSPSFRAITELLETGRTALLPAVPPNTNMRGAAEYQTMPEPVLYPTEASLAAGLLGSAPRRFYRPPSPASFRVKVVHGDLQYASHPVVVGHYEGDTIVGAEAQLDKRLGRALSQRYELGLYPGASGTIAVILQRPNAVQQALQLPTGAVVIGLGKWGDLAAGELADLLRRAALEYMLQRCEGLGAFSAADSPKVGLSVLLVGGTSTTNITVADSVGAILRAIAQANRELARGNCKAMTIQDLEIIELYADRATEAAHAVNQLAPVIGNELDTEIEAAPLLERGREGRQRLRLTTERTAAWRRWEVSVVTPPSKPNPARLPVPLADRLKRAVLESENADAELLKALAELAFRQPSGPDAHRAIRFLTLSDRARAEATTQQRQPELVVRLIKSAISQTRFYAEESRVLFELMVPNELKAGLNQVDNLVLVLDEETATYPWELMSSGDKPLCIAKCLVRQLQTSNYRRQIGTRAAKDALVIGNPKVSAPFKQLPGAEAEAKAVYEVLRSKFTVEQPLSTPSALEVLARLYQKPYRILHLAGHGHYEPPITDDDTARSGLVLENGIFLTAVEVKQMQQVPELVFLNCCHIGQTGPESGGVAAATSAPGVEFNRLAASVSRELIEMGVRAVVAAGWAVRDDAAKDFAEAFYRSMLDNETFGRALKAARVHTYARFPLTNTWGAYQAYGDPDYRLDPAVADNVRTGHGPVAVPEFIEAVVDIAAATKHGADPIVAANELAELRKRCPSEWLELTDVQMALGKAYGDLGQFEAARGYLEMALAGEGERSTTTLRAVEDLANYEARIKEPDNATAERLHLSAVSRINNLLHVAKTSERYALLGGTYRRRAMATADVDVEAARDALTKAAKSYQDAHDFNWGRGILDPYPTLNWLTWAAVLGQQVPEANELLERCEATASELFVADRKFYTAIAMADGQLVRALIDDRLGQDNGSADTELHRLHERYQQVFCQANPNPSEVNSVGSQIEDIARLIEKLAPADRTARATATATQLKRLHRMMSGDANDADDTTESTDVESEALAENTIQ